MTATRPLRYAEMRPGADAASVALTYWVFDVHALPDPAFQHRVWPDGCTSLVLVVAGGQVVAARVQGVCTAPLDVPVHPGVRYCGVRFRPEVGALWCGQPALSLVNANLDAHAVFGAALAPLLHTVPVATDDDALAVAFDAWIATQAAARAPSRVPSGVLPGLDVVVRDAVDRLIADDGRTRIADVAVALGVSSRTLQRRFVASVGLTPKAFAQIRRARRMLQRTVQDGRAAMGGWSAIAAEAGYADQAHLTREVGRLTRFSPSRLEERLDVIDHARLVD